jgi:hypothetical protein
MHQFQIVSFFRQQDISHDHDKLLAEESVEGVEICCCDLDGASNGAQAELNIIQSVTKIVDQADEGG